MESKKTPCWLCGEIIESGDNYCRHCGIAQNQKSKFPYTILGIVLSFFVIGPFCLLKLWKSPLISNSKKRILGMIIIIVTVAILISLLQFIQTIIAYYSSAFNIDY